MSAYRVMLTKGKNNLPVEPDVFKPIVSKKFASVTSKIIFVLKKLYKGEIFELDRLYEGISDRNNFV